MTHKRKRGRTCVRGFLFYSPFTISTYIFNAYIFLSERKKEKKKKEKKKRITQRSK